MHISLIDKILWISGLPADLLVLVVLLARRGWRQFPAFTAWMTYTVLITIAFMSLYLEHASLWYARTYYASLFPDFVLQLLVALEIARIVLRPTGTWIRDARGIFVAAALGGAVVAGLLSWWIAPTHGGRSIWELRSNLFTSLVICEVFVAMSMTANRLGLGWRNHVMALGQGLTTWAAIMLIANSLESYFGGHFFMAFERLRIGAWDAAMLWIGVQLWAPEPERHPISEELQRYILALHRRVEYDLRRLDARN
jgi:hypothetical protein